MLPLPVTWAAETARIPVRKAVDERGRLQVALPPGALMRGHSAGQAVGGTRG
jgi:hypothetical protein